MRICYDPHEGVNFTAGSLLYAFGKGHDLACKGLPVDDPGGDGLCQAGHVRLDLPLDSERRDRCGTKRLMSDVSAVTSNLTYISTFNVLALVGVFNYDVSRASRTISSPPRFLIFRFYIVVPIIFALSISCCRRYNVSSAVLYFLSLVSFLRCMPFRGHKRGISTHVRRTPLFERIFEPKPYVQVIQYAFVCQFLITTFLWHYISKIMA